jgi:hypothetical protein
MAFPTTYTDAVDNVTTIAAAHLNNIEDTLLITADRAKFMAYNSATDANVTGDGTAVTIDFDTEILDIGADFASDTFTAPGDGWYLLTATVQVDELGAAHTVGYITIVTTKRTYLRNLCNPYACSAGGSYQFHAIVLANMDATDTAYVQVTVFNGTKVCDIYGAASTRTQFAGVRLI